MWQSLLAKLPSLADSNTAPEIKTHAFTYIPTAPSGDVLHNPLSRTIRHEPFLPEYLP